MFELSKKLKKPSIIDVAKHAGVSKSTVSLVITRSEKVSEKTKNKVIKSIDELGYIYNREAAALKGKRSNLVAIFINDITEPITLKRLLELELVIKNFGFLPIQINTHECSIKQEHAFNVLKEYNIAAYFMFPVTDTSTTWINDITKLGFPVINVFNEIPYSNVKAALTNLKD